MADFKGIVKLSEEQYQSLKTNGSLTVGEKTITYDAKTTVYVTPPKLASETEAGVILLATDIDISDGTSTNKAVTPAQLSKVNKANTDYVDTQDNALQEQITSNATSINGLVMYDLIIRTQEEFEAFYATLDDGTCTASSVLFVGDGGTLEFTRSDGLGLHLPVTLKRLDGINSATITITNFSYNYSTNKGAIWYTTKPDQYDYCINNLKCNYTFGATSYIPGFYNCYQLTNCTVSGTCTMGYGGYGFQNCKRLMNCTSSMTGGNSNGSGFYGCNHLTNCSGDYSGTSATAFNQCYYLTNCIGTGTGSNSNGRGFYFCYYLTNCIGTGTGTQGRGFDTCKQLTNCSGKGITNNAGTSNYYGYSFYGCSYLSSCTSSGTSTTAIWGGTNTYRDDDSCKLDA